MSPQHGAGAETHHIAPQPTSPDNKKLQSTAEVHGDRNGAYKAMSGSLALPLQEKSK